MAASGKSGPENLHTLVSVLWCIVCFQRITFLRTYLNSINSVYISVLYKLINSVDLGIILHQKHFIYVFPICQSTHRKVKNINFVSLYFLQILTKSIIGHWHKISNNVICATSKGSDQPAHRRRLIRAFTGRLNIL